MTLINFPSFYIDPSMFLYYALLDAHQEIFLFDGEMTVSSELLCVLISFGHYCKTPSERQILFLISLHSSPSNIYIFNFNGIMLV